MILRQKAARAPRRVPRRNPLASSWGLDRKTSMRE
jgi:hypothetical protein